MEVRHDGLHRHPVLPAELGSLGSRVRYRGHLVHPDFTTETVHVGMDLAEGAPNTVDISGTRAVVRAGEAIDMPLGTVADRVDRSGHG
jgi:dUTPase